MRSVETPEGSGAEPTVPVEGVEAYDGELTRATTVSPPLRWGVAIVLALAIGATRNDTFVATALVAVGGLLIIGVGRLAPPARKPVLARVGLYGAVVWGTVFVVFNLWELGTFLLGDNDDHPTFTVLTGSAMHWFPSRVALSLLWLAIGWRALER